MIYVLLIQNNHPHLPRNYSTLAAALGNTAGAVNEFIGYHVKVVHKRTAVIIQQGLSKQF